MPGSFTPAIDTASLIEDQTMQVKQGINSRVSFHN